MVFQFKPTLSCFVSLVLGLYKAHFSPVVWLRRGSPGGRAGAGGEGTGCSLLSASPQQWPSSLVAVSPVSRLLLHVQNQPHHASSPPTPGLPVSARQHPTWEVWAPAPRHPSLQPLHPCRVLIIPTSSPL